MTLIIKSQQRIEPWFSISGFSSIKQIESGGFVIVKQTPRNMDWQLTSIQLSFKDKSFELWNPNICEFFQMEFEGQHGFTLHKQFVGLISGAKLEESFLSDKGKSMFTMTKHHTYLDMGRQHALAGNYDEAIAFYKHEIRMNPDKEEIYHSMGVCYANKGNTDLAVYNYKRALELNPDFADPYVGIGNIHLQEKKLDEAISFYDEAIKRRQNALFAYIHRGLAYCYKKNFKNALSDLNTAEKINPDVSPVYENRAFVYSCMGEDEKAYQDLEKAKTCRIQLKGSPISPKHTLWIRKDKDKHTNP